MHAVENARYTRYICRNQKFKHKDISEVQLFFRYNENQYKHFSICFYYYLFCEKAITKKPNLKIRENNFSVILCLIRSFYFISLEFLQLERSNKNKITESIYIKKQRRCFGCLSANLSVYSLTLKQRGLQLQNSVHRL